MVDAHSSRIFAKQYLSKVPTAVDVLHDRVRQFNEERGGEIEQLLTDNGGEHCGRPFELYLTIRQIQQQRTDWRTGNQRPLRGFHRAV